MTNNYGPNGRSIPVFVEPAVEPDRMFTESEVGGGGYVLPVATAAVLGGIKDGAGVTVDAGGVLSLDIATAAALGGVKDGTGVTVDAGGVLSLDIATAAALGGVKIGAGVTVDAEGVISVPAAAQALITIIQDQKAQNTAGGTFTSGAWRTRDLNTYQVNQIGLAALNANRFVLPAGTYEIAALAAAIAVDYHKLQLYNVTDGAAVSIIGSSNYANATSFQDKAALWGVFTIAANKTFELQHYCSTTKATVGFGIATNLATEVYTIVNLRKVA